MYCSIQEAYKIPAFDPASKKRAPRSCAAPTEAAEPYDMYAPDTGRELAAAYRPFGKEDFTDYEEPDTVTSNPRSGNNTYGKRDTLGSRDVDRPSYAAMAQDHTYICKDYNVCPKVLPSTRVREGFDNPRRNASRTKRVAPAPAAANAGKCGPLQPPMYEIPVAEDAKKQYDLAMDAAMTQETGATLSAPSQPRKVDMSKVSGYYDEDLEMYLRTHDMKAMPASHVPQPKTPTPFRAEPYDPRTSPLAEALQKYGDRDFASAYARSSTPSPYTAFVPALPKKATGTALWLDLLVFVLVGLLLVFLCDLLVRVGMMMGMRETATLLSPWLQQLRELPVSEAK